MFGSLKEKLKNWTTKIKEEIFGKEEINEKSEKSSKIEKKPQKTKRIKEVKLEKKLKEEKIREVAKKEKALNEKSLNETTHVLERQITTKENVLEKKAESLKGKSKEKRSFFSRLFRIELTKEKFEELFQELEITLLQNNVAYEVVEKIKEELSSKIIGRRDYEIDEELKKIIEEILIEPLDFIQEIKNSLKEKKPFIISLVGINGSGKTTTLAKLTSLLQKNKFSVCLAAADSYRAASIEQLETHATRLDVPIIKKEYGHDPASIGFEAIQYAKKHNIDIVMIDTAGRLNNKESLMKELEKIIRVTKPDMKIFVGEATTGNDATEQAKTFNELIGLTGIILSKADVDEKGGTMISVGYITKKPILFLGIGQKYEDLEIFNKQKIIKNLGL